MGDNAVRQIVLASRPKGPPKTEKFRLEEMSMSAARSSPTLSR
jgi:NADPH-dependent curcumin reductase CurA